MAEKMSLCITTDFTDDYSKIGRLCVRSIEKYAKKFGHHVDFIKDISSDRHPVWNRILIVKKLFLKGYDFVFWIDSDALFVRYDEDICSELENGKDLYVVERHSHGGKHINFGVSVIRNSPWSNKLLDEIWSKEEYLNHCWREQAALLDLFGLIGFLGSEHRKKLGFSDEPSYPNEELLKKVKILDLKWNSWPDKEEAKNPIINHYPSRHNQIRFYYMAKDAYAASLISRYEFLVNMARCLPSLACASIDAFYIKLPFLRYFKDFLKKVFPGWYLKFKKISSARSFK